MSAKILIVEDEQLVALDIQRRLTQLGYMVVAIADSAQTALEAVAKHHPDLVLMDIHLKGNIDGITTATQIRAEYHLPVIFLTAHADEATVSQAKETQPFGYLIKPVQTKNLSTAIEIALTRHQAEVIMQTALDKEREVSESLQRALEQEKTLNELKSQFVSMISHEFRNPLSTIILGIDSLELRNTQFTPEQRLQKFQRLKKAANTLVQLIEDVLTLSETEAKHFQCHPVPTDVLSFCQELIDDFQSMLVSKHTILFKVCGCQEADKAFYNLDEKLLGHILTNLLSNAIKYSADGSEVIFLLSCETEAVVFRIQDQGIGISPEDREHLFESFRRGTNVKTISGTGLGLAIVKKCLNAHQGSIAVESEVGVGTTFTVTIPQNLGFLDK
ncbi:ATP-binding protein [Tumidithrix helvetica PCC 7403]|uniref:hybrid sensor histidine kinase/response regulator n=1 Tax=Tumidithrix helvetica TaxID=3457545 RepID=UPI003C8064E7